MAATNLPGTLPSANYMPTYRSNGACDDLAALVAPYSLSRAQLAEATGIADEATVNSWVEQCRPDLAADAPAPLEPVLRYLDETYLPDPANWLNAEPTAEAGEYLQEAIANAPESLHPLLTELLLPALREARGTFTAPEVQLLTGYALAAGYYAGEHPYETLNGIHVAFAADDRTLPDDELMSRVEDVLKANFSAARAEAGAADENPEPHHVTLPGDQDGYETAAHLIAALPQAHDVIVFSTPEGDDAEALAADRRAAFTLYLCYLLLGDDDSLEQRAAELYRASREK